MEKYILAHDLGTSGNKATLYTTYGKLIKSSVSGYTTKYYNQNWAEQDPNDWWKAVCLSTREIIVGIEKEKIGAICFSGQMMGCLCVDKKGNPLNNHLLYCDQRATKEETEILNKIDLNEFYKITGHRASASYSVAKLMWIKNNLPEIYKNTYKMLHAKDFINYKMTGKMFTEYSDASGTNLLDLNTYTWSDQLIDVTGIEGDKLPKLCNSTDCIDVLTKQAAEEMNLRHGIPVIAGGGDGVCAGVGAGSVAPGKTYNYLGSSSWIATTTKEPLYDENMRTFVWAHAIPGYFHPCGTVQTAGSSYSWMKDELALLEKKEAENKKISPYEILENIIKSAPPGSNGLIFLPYLLGERTPRWNPNAKGSLIGLTLSHKRSEIFRSVLEGVTYNLSLIVDIFRNYMSIDEITLIGGGAISEEWRQMISDIYEAEILKPKYLEEATSMGAAVIGGVGSGLVKDFTVVDDFIEVEERRKPNIKNQSIYRESKKIFDNAYYSLEKIFDQLSRIKKVEE